MTTSIKNYNFDLPSDLIAQHPLKNTKDHRMMVVDRKNEKLIHAKVSDFVDYVCINDCIVVNNTKVVNACLLGQFRTGGDWEGLFLDIANGCWRILLQSKNEIKPRQTLVLKTNSETFELTLIDRDVDGVWIALPERQANHIEILTKFGNLPLPPYIREGISSQEDSLSYQTFYATCYGAIAAPSAGLHFSQEMMDSIKKKNISIYELTLHVGLGTYKPIYSEDITKHKIHSEWMQINQETARQISIAKKRGKVFAIGTTSLRALETASLGGEIKPYEGYTDLYVKPGFDFVSTDALLTNFHLPRTTLMVLVKAFAGDELIDLAYKEAIERSYRFCDYGDAMLII
ncbi:MAG: tRNA preQ1(34) S-adenosylmethionine ribosyltransferase-isomerase QueA [Victivallales bacterium]|nr:tRNA preQ1(34) S-adenosylmethionine ribosyltransferase-isomerase QueA [Victivallales bacterium]